MFRPKVKSSGAAVIYCAKCIFVHSPAPRQAVTIYSGEALCPEHLSDHTKFQFLKSEDANLHHLEVPN